MDFKQKDIHDTLDWARLPPYAEAAAAVTGSTPLSPPPPPPALPAVAGSDQVWPRGVRAAAWCRTKWGTWWRREAGW